MDNFKKSSPSLELLRSEEPHQGCMGEMCAAHFTEGQPRA